MRYYSILLLLFSNMAVFAQTGPYPVFEFPPDSLWAVFDSVQKERELSFTVVGQPKLTAGRAGVVLSPQGLALVPSTALDSALIRNATWLADDEGQPLPATDADELAVLTEIEDITDEILIDLPDNLSPAARSILIANRLLKYRQEALPPHTVQEVLSLYQGNRHYRYRWRLQQARLLGQVVVPDGPSFALVRLQPAGDGPKEDYACLPPNADASIPGSPHYLAGLQTFPRAWAPLPDLRIQYTEISPLIEESQQVLNEAWGDSQVQPDWLTAAEAARELETPLHPFADPGRAATEAQQRENALLEALAQDRDTWWVYERRQEGLRNSYAQLAPFLGAKKLCLDIIPTRLQLFRLVNLLVRWRESTAEHPEIQERMAKSMLTYLVHFYASFDPETDRQATAGLLDLYFRRIRYNLQSPYVIEQWLQAEKDPQILAAALYQKSGLIDARQTLEDAQQDPAAFLNRITNDYAFQFVETWMREHRARIAVPLQRLEELLQEEQRKLIAGMLQYAPGAAPVERGGVSFVQLPAGMEEAGAHDLGFYPVGSPVVTESGTLAGITYYDGQNPYFLDQTSNRLWPVGEFLHILRTQFPDHPITRELTSTP